MTKELQLSELCVQFSIVSLTVTIAFNMNYVFKQVTNMNNEYLFLNMFYMIFNIILCRERKQ